MISLPLLKFIAAIALFIQTFISGIIPIKFNTFSQSPQISSMSNCFAGGLFLGLSMLHLLPESQDEFEQSQIFERFGDDQINDSFTELQSSVSKLNQTEIDQLLFLLSKSSVNFQLQTKTSSFPWINAAVIFMFFSIAAIQNILFGHSHSHGDHQGEKNHQVENQIDEPKNSQKNQSDFSQIQPIHIHSSQAIDDVSQRDESNHKQTTCIDEYKQVAQYEEKQSSATPFLLLLALSIHCFFEGLALGIMRDRAQSITFMIAVMAHKWAEALALGIEMKKCNFSYKRSVLYILVLASLNILGVIAGLFLERMGTMVTSVFEAISVGTFLYISTMEILSEEFSDSKFKYKKFISSAGAVLFVCLLQIHFQD